MRASISSAANPASAKIDLDSAPGAPQLAGNSVSVLASGSVDGSITGTSVSVDGKAHGVISASDLSLASSGTVMADVTYETLSTDKGAKLQGNLKVK